VSFGGAVSRLVEFGERQRRLQMRTACALLLRHGDCSPECFLGGSGIGWVASKQDVAAQAMQEGKRATMFDFVREAQSFIDAGQRAVRSQRFRLELRQQPAVEPQVDPDALIDESRENPPNLGCASDRIIKPTPRPTGMQFGLVDILRHPALSREDLQNLSRAKRRRRIGTPDFQIRFPEERIGNCSTVPDL
jgi:hypothetical protein